MVCFLSEIVNKLQETHQISKLFVFSDGCSGQFKNKFILRTPHFLKSFNLNAFEWNFFATTHGKGAVDGIGAVVKRKVWELIRTQNIVLCNASDFYSCAKQNISGIQVMYISSIDIDDKVEPIGKMWNSVKSIPKLNSYHHFKYLKENNFISKNCEI